MCAERHIKVIAVNAWSTGICATTRNGVNHSIRVGFKETRHSAKSICTEDVVKYSEEKPPTQPWEEIQADFILRLPESGPYENNSLLVIEDKFSKYVILIPTHNNVTAKECALLFRDNVFKRFGVPGKLVSDRDSKFLSQWFTEFLKSINMKAAHGTAWHHQTTGGVERKNRTIETR